MWCGGTPPLGYDVDRDTQTLIINEKEAKAVKLAFKLRAQGFSYSYITEQLNRRGYKTKLGNSTKIEKQLESILQSLDEETLLRLEAVMYLGRDYNVSEEGTPKELYELLLNHLKSLGNDKEVIIEMMSSKVSLGSYLKAGLKLLEVYL